MAETNQYNSLSLAFLGDAVYSLMVRERLIKDSGLSAGRLHKMSVESVNAAAQSEAMHRILPLLTEEENDVFRRARNSHPHHVPKNQETGDYHYATALEALFGYLYLEKKYDRLNELFEVIYSQR
ncbi:MAG: ribonuclease III [Ruminococcaceae bacterium]|nr:ribonuclease III [Oscillospiraceae bacterium]